MARRRKNKSKPEMGSERPFSDLSDDEYNALQEKARFRMDARQSDQNARDYVAGEGTLPRSNPAAAEKLIQARALRSQNDRMAAGTQAIRDRVDTVRNTEPGAKPDYSGFIPAHLKPGYKPPVKPVDPNVVENAQDIMKTAEGYKSSGAYAQAMKDDPYLKDRQGTTVAITDEQRAAPNYKRRVDDARLAAEAHKRRQMELDSIKNDVQDQRYREALENRGMGIRNRAIASRQRRDAVIDYRREGERMQSMTPEGRAAYLIDKNRNNRAGSDREFTSRENQLDRQSAEKIAQTRAQAPAGNRGYTQEQDRRAWKETASSFNPIIGNLKDKIDTMEPPLGADKSATEEFNEEVGNMKRFYQKVLRGQQAIHMGTPFFPGGNLDQWAKQQGLVPGDEIVGLDKDGYPLLGQYQPE